LGAIAPLFFFGLPAHWRTQAVFLSIRILHNFESDFLFILPIAFYPEIVYTIDTEREVDIMEIKLKNGETVELREDCFDPELRESGYYRLTPYSFRELWNLLRKCEMSSVPVKLSDVFSEGGDIVGFNIRILDWFGIEIKSDGSMSFVDWGACEDITFEK
jgi:hypothetical protein